MFSISVSSRWGDYFCTHSINRSNSPSFLFGLRLFYFFHCVKFRKNSALMPESKTRLIRWQQNILNLSCALSRSSGTNLWIFSKIIPTVLRYPCFIFLKSCTSSLQPSSKLSIFINYLLYADIFYSYFFIYFEHQLIF